MINQEKGQRPAIEAPDSGLLLDGNAETKQVEIKGHLLEFTHLNKVLWPDDGITKRAMLNFYDQVSDYMMPYLRDRPMSLNRFPNGIHEPHFYQKDVTGKAPDWATTYAHLTADGKSNHYLVGTDEASLMWMASLGCIEINPWLSRVSTADNPDYCVIDLDPDDHNSFQQVIEVARIVRNVLDSINVPSFPKTSGSTGIHIYIPLGPGYSYKQSQSFANLIVRQVNRELPDLTSLERMVASRKKKMYLDFLQNRPEATIASPYSLRPKPGATVSMPLTWDEVRPGLHMKDFTILNSIARLKETGDLFNGIFENGIDLNEATIDLRAVV